MTDQQNVRRLSSKTGQTDHTFDEPNQKRPAKPERGGGKGPEKEWRGKQARGAKQQAGKGRLEQIKGYKAFGQTSVLKLAQKKELNSFLYVIVGKFVQRL